MKNVLIIAIAVFSSSGFAQEKLKNEIKSFEVLTNEKKSAEINNINDVVFNLDFDKNLLSENDIKCYIPFSSWEKSVNLYNQCSVKITEKNIIVIELMSLQNKIRVNYEDNKPIFFDRITMKLNTDCNEVINNTKIISWTYLNREEKTFFKQNLDNVNWFLTASAEKLGREMCEKNLPKVYDKALENQRLKQEKWKANKEREEKRISDKNKDKEAKKSVKKRIKKD